MMTPTPPSAESAPDAPRVFLAAWPASASARELLLALAGRGHSLVLWLAAGVPAAGVAPDADAVLDFQLELTRAGGIVLAHEAPSLQAAAEAFGRIELALALDEAEAGAMARAAAELERERRPGRLLLLRTDGNEPGITGQPLAVPSSLPVALPAGMKLSVLEMKNLAPGDLTRRIVELVASPPKPPRPE